MKNKFKEELKTIGLLLHVGHLFSGYSIKEISDFAKGYIMGISITLEFFDIDSGTVIQRNDFTIDQLKFGIEHFLRAYYFTKFLSWDQIKGATDALNALDLSDIIEKAKSEMEEMARNENKKDMKFFIDPGIKIKQ